MHIQWIVGATEFLTLVLKCVLTKKSNYNILVELGEVKLLPFDVRTPRYLMMFLHRFAD